MKTKQVNPMPAFVGTGFDCQLSGSAHFLNSLYSNLNGVIHNQFCEAKLYVASTTLVDWDYCRPRLNKPQVLPDWSWLDNPLLDGFIWGDWADQTFSSEQIATYFKQDLLRKPISFHICGVEKGSQLEDWAIENDVPIYNDKMEVVK